MPNSIDFHKRISLHAIRVRTIVPCSKQTNLHSKSEKGNYIIIVDRDKYIEKMENFLSD